MNRGRDALLVFGVALASRLFFVVFSPFTAGDTHDYESIALNLIQGRGYSMFPPSPTVFRTPVYPLFVAGIYEVFGPHQIAVMVVQALVGSVGICLLWLLARRILTPNLALAGGLFAGAYPHVAFYSATLLSETVSFFLLAAVMLAAAVLPTAKRWYLFALSIGGLCALMAMSSPRWAPFPAAIVLLFLIWRIPIRRLARVIALMALTYAAVLSPWVVRNAIVFRSPILLTSGEWGLGEWMVTHGIGLYDYNFAAMAQREPLAAEWLYLYQQHPDEELPLFAQRVELERKLRDSALSAFRADPIGVIAHQAGLYPNLWLQPAAYAGHFRPPFQSQNANLADMVRMRAWLPAALRLASILVFTAALFGGLLLGLAALRRRWREMAVLLLPAAYVALFQFPFPIEHRASVLTHPFLWFVAVPGLVWAWKALQAQLRLSRETVPLGRNGAELESAAGS